MSYKTGRSGGGGMMTPRTTSTTRQTTRMRNTTRTASATRPVMSPRTPTMRRVNSSARSVTTRAGGTMQRSITPMSNAPRVVNNQMNPTYSRRLQSMGRFSRIANRRAGSFRASTRGGRTTGNSGANYLQNRVTLVNQSYGVRNAPGSRLK